MRLTVIGCSGSFAGPNSPASCYLLRAEDELGQTHAIVLDLGSGALGALQRHLDPRDLDAVFLSHLHPDHCLDLTGLYVMHRYHPTGPTRPRVPVWGPEGTGLRLAQAYGGSEGRDLAGVFDVHEHRNGESVQVGPFTVTPFEVWHPVPAFGLRVVAGGKVLAFTGDTDQCENLTPLMTGADLVLADSAFVDGRDEVRGIHMTGSRCADSALAAGGVGRLMLTHLPAWNDPQVCRDQAGSRWPGGPEAVELAAPDTTYQL